MAIEYSCDVCDIVLTTSSEIGQRGVLIEPTRVLDAHLAETGHEQFSAKGVYSVISIEVFDVKDHGRAVSITGNSVL